MENIQVEVAIMTIKTVGKKVVNSVKKMMKRKVNLPEGLKIINMSGHELSERCILALINKFKIMPENIINIKMVKADHEDLQKAAGEMVIKVAEKISKQLTTGEYVLIPAGLSPLSLIIISMLHGISGHFPKIQPLKRDDFGFIPTEALYDLQSMREAFRNIMN